MQIFRSAALFFASVLERQSKILATYGRSRSGLDSNFLLRCIQKIHMGRRSKREFFARLRENDMLL
jgi:hypothetical protein